jgi:hypothetical protein
MGSHWVDLDGIEAEAAELIERDPGEAERFYGNRIVAGADKAFDLDAYAALERLVAIPPGRLVTLGFDGALMHDATGLVVTDVESRHQSVVAWWQRPPALPDEAEWQVPIDELNEAVEFAFDTWRVWRGLFDPPHYRDDLNRWAGLYGDDKVVEFWTNVKKQMAYALRDFRTDMRSGVMSHGPLVLDPDAQPDARAIEAHRALLTHIGNAVRRATNMRDEDDDGRTSGRFLWLISKERAKSPNKIDLAMAAVLAWRARGDAEKSGALNQTTRPFDLADYRIVRM